MTTISEAKASPGKPALRRFEIVRPGVERTAALSLIEVSAQVQLEPTTERALGALKLFERVELDSVYVVRVEDATGGEAADPRYPADGIASCYGGQDERDEAEAIDEGVDALETWLVTRSDATLIPRTPKNVLAVALEQLEAQSVRIAELERRADAACVEPRDDCECSGCSFAAGQVQR